MYTCHKLSNLVRNIVDLTIYRAKIFNSNILHIPTSFLMNSLIIQQEKYKFIIFLNSRVSLARFVVGKVTKNKK